MVENFLFYSIMIDESTNISVTDHLFVLATIIIFAIIIKKCVSMTVFLGLLDIENGKNTTIIF